MAMTEQKENWKNKGGNNNSCPTNTPKVKATLMIDVPPWTKEASMIKLEDAGGIKIEEHFPQFEDGDSNILLIKALKKGVSVA